VRPSPKPVRELTSNDFLRARENWVGQMTCPAGRRKVLSWSVGRPPVSAVVPDLLVGCGPNVAPLRAHRGHDRRGRSGTSMAAMPPTAVTGEAGRSQRLVGRGMGGSRQSSRATMWLTLLGVGREAITVSLKLNVMSLRTPVRPNCGVVRPGAVTG